MKHLSGCVAPFSEAELSTVFAYIMSLKNYPCSFFHIPTNVRKKLCSPRNLTVKLADKQNHSDESKNILLWVDNSFIFYILFHCFCPFCFEIVISGVPQPDQDSFCWIVCLV